jgi:hypothetical protein
MQKRAKNVLREGYGFVTANFLVKNLKNTLF